MAMELGAFTPFLWMHQGARDGLGHPRGGDRRAPHAQLRPHRRHGARRPPTGFKEHVPRRSCPRSSSVVERGRAAARCSNRIFLDRLEGVGVISRRRRDLARRGRARACARPASPTTCARRTRTCSYDEVDFDVPVGHDGDNYDRFMVRLEEMRQSVPHHRAGARAHGRRRARSTSTTRASSCPPKEEVYTTIEGTIQHFKIVMEGVKVPAGRGLLVHRGRQRRARLLPRVATAAARPYRVRMPAAVLLDHRRASSELITGAHDRRHRPDLRLAQHDRRRVRSLSGLTASHAPEPLHCLIRADLTRMTHARVRSALWPPRSARERS